MEPGSWALVEVMGHRRYVGRVTETTFAGAPMLEVAVPEWGQAHGVRVPATTVLVAPGSLFAVTPLEEEDARLMLGQGGSHDSRPYRPRLTMAPPEDVSYAEEAVEVPWLAPHADQPHEPQGIDDTCLDCDRPWDHPIHVQPAGEPPLGGEVPGSTETPPYEATTPTECIVKGCSNLREGSLAMCEHHWDDANDAEPTP